MSNVSEAILLVTIIAVVAVIAYSFIVIRSAIYKITNRKSDLMKIEEMIYSQRIDQLDQINRRDRIKYSTELIKFIRETIGTVAIIKVRTFVDNKDMKNVTRGQIEKVAQDVALTVNNTLDREHISFGKTMFDESYYNTFIVETSIIVVKDLFEHEIDEYRRREYGEE